MSQQERTYVLFQDRILGLFKGLVRSCGRAQLPPMLRFHSIACGLLISYSALHAQNLVPNPSFEEYTQCPDGYGQFLYVQDWFWPLIGNPDYFNACSTQGNVGVPNNIWSYQQPASGSAYMGMIGYGMGNPGYGLHEIIGVHLPTTLVVGQTYYGSFKISWTSGYPNIEARTKYASDHMGMLLRRDSLSGETDWLPWPDRAQIYTTTIVTDSVNWTVISGHFVADSAYSYLYIGNFFGDELVETIVMQADADDASYYYVDDVCLSADPTFCPLSTGIQNPGRSDNATLHWDENGRGVWVNGMPQGEFVLSCYDTAGRIQARATVVSTGVASETFVQLAQQVFGLSIFRLQGGGREWHCKLAPPIQ